MRIRVECYSGYRADEHPLRFHLGGKVLEVERVEDRWYSPDATWFRVQAADGNIYVLRHSIPDDLWSVESCRTRADS